jgi:hypothetical protein
MISATKMRRGSKSRVEGREGAETWAEMSRPCAGAEGIKTVQVEGSLRSRARTQLLKKGKSPYNFEVEKIFLTIQNSRAVRGKTDNLTT